MAWMEYLTIRATDNPQVTGIDATLLLQFFGRGLQVDTGVAQCNAVTSPSHSTFGIKCPRVDCGAFTRLENCFVMGHDVGILLGEHADLDGCQVWGCNKAVQVPNSNHGMRIGRILDVHCPIGIHIIASGTPHPRMTVVEYGCEFLDAGHLGSAPSWQLRQNDVFGNDVLYGGGKFASVMGNVGPSNQWLAPGITNFVMTSLGA